jgi:predicted transcriptional regulator
MAHLRGTDGQHYNLQFKLKGRLEGLPESMVSNRSRLALGALQSQVEKQVSQLASD